MKLYQEAIDACKDSLGAKEDYAETAALIASLDLIVTVDTSVAHLAGALGKPVRIMITHMPDFRWLLNRNDSPWYLSARLFRQNHIGGWGEVIREVKLELTDYMKNLDVSSGQVKEGSFVKKIGFLPLQLQS